MRWEKSSGISVFLRKRRKKRTKANLCGNESRKRSKKMAV
jgi:hypothetical protein